MDKMIKPSISMPVDLVNQVKKYQKENFLPSFSATVTFLVFTALKKGENKHEQKIN